MEWEKIAEKIRDLVLGEVKREFKEVLHDIIFRVERLETKMAA